MTLAITPILISLLSTPSILLFYFLDYHRLCSGPDPRCPDENLDGSLMNPHAVHLDISGDHKGISLRYNTLLFSVTLYIGTGFTLAIFIVSMKWLLAGFYVQPGPYTRTTFTKWRRWWLGLLQGALIFWFSRAGMWSGYTIYSIWFRLLGAKIGRYNVLPDFTLVHPEDAHLLEIGDHTVFSTSTVILDITLENGQAIKTKVKIGSYCFVGFHSRIEGTVTLEDTANVAWLTNIVGDPNKPQTLCRGRSRMAGLTMTIPRGTQKFMHAVQSGEKDMRNLRCQYCRTVGVDVFMTFTRLLGYCLALLVAYEAGVDLFKFLNDSTLKFIVCFAALLLLWTFLLVVVIKIWMVAFDFFISYDTLKYEEFIEQPVRTYGWVQRMNHQLTLYSSIVFSVFAGSGLYNVVLRLFGAKVGNNACIISLRILDHENVEIGAGAVVEDGALINGHVYSGFEVIWGLAVVGKGSSIGRGSYLHAGEKIGDNGSLGSLSKLFRRNVSLGEHWKGIPAKPPRNSSFSNHSIQTMMAEYKRNGIPA
mmetsp:Transcript_21641/g.30336  ORF Transcript_21641/g.30336 Transcript_21641/m.30336 type:complete len:533 (-) Transcript_21641:268-1866(-)